MYNKTISKFPLTAVLFLGLLIACKPIQVMPDIQPTSISTPTPTSILSPIKVAATLVSNPDYINECLLINSSDKQGQLDYRGILPGKSNEKDVKEKLGSPEREYFLNQRFWNYENGNVSISFNNSRVSEVTVSNYQNVVGNLENIVLNNGCPNLIFIIDPREAPVGGYGITKFIYLKLGVEFTFETFPASLTDTPIFYTFFPPQSLNSYLLFSKNAYLHPDAGKPVTWAEAVR